MKYFYDVLTAKDFAKLYFDSINTSRFADWEKARCIRHLSLYSLIVLEHKKDPLKNSEHL